MRIERSMRFGYGRVALWSAGRRRPDPLPPPPRLRRQPPRCRRAAPSCAAKGCESSPTRSGWPLTVRSRIQWPVPPPPSAVTE
jgi:hypothetical protein